MINKEIAEYILKNYPNSLFANNHYDGVSYEFYDNFFSHELLGLCSCGDPDKCKVVIRDLLFSLSETNPNTRSQHLMFYFDVKSIYENPLLLFMVYMLNDKGFLEHGSSVGSSYTTELGKMYLYILQKLPLEDI